MRSLNLPLAVLTTLGATCLLVALWRDNSSGITQPMSLAPMLIANALGFAKFMRIVVSESPPESGEDKAICAFCILFILCWNTAFWVLAFSSAPVATAIAPLWIAWAAEGVTLTLLIKNDGGVIGALAHGCCFWTPWFVQMLLIALKMDGDITSTWATVLTPLWILDLLLLFTLLVLTHAFLSDERDDPEKMANLVAAWCGFIPIAASELLLADIGSEITRLRIVTPILVGWGCLLLVRAFGFVLDRGYAARACCDGVRNRLHDKQQEEAARASRVASAVVTKAADSASGDGDGAAAKGGIASEGVVVEIAHDGEGGMSESMPSLPSSLVGVHADVERMLARCANNKDTATVHAALADLLKLLTAHPAYQTAAVRERVVKIGKAQAGRPAWDKSVQEMMGKVLRLLHPISTIRARMAYHLGQAHASVRSRMSGRA